MIPEMVASKMPELIPELGHIALIIALAFSICLSLVPLIGVQSAHNSSLKRLMGYAKPLTYGMFVFTAISLVILAYSFVIDDFSIKYIASHSNSHLPYYFKISAVWGGHEGSLLLWVFSLTAWSAAVARFSKGIEEEFITRVLSVMGMIAIGFIALPYLPQIPLNVYGLMFQ